MLEERIAPHTHEELIRRTSRGQPVLSHPPYQTYFTSILVLIFGIVLALGLIELAFRLLPSSDAPTWSDRPHYFVMPENSRYLRDATYAMPKPPGAIRIAVVGDSFTFGPKMQYDDAFPKRLERWLNLNNEQPMVEVMNFGVPGFSTRRELAMVNQAFDKDADLVIVQITLNDPELAPLTPAQRTAIFGHPPEARGILRYWRSLHFLLTRLYFSRTHRLYRKYFFDLWTNARTSENFRGAIGELAKQSHIRKVPVLAVVFPLFDFPLDDNYPFTAIHQKIAATLKQSQIPALDLLNAFHGIPHERLQVLPGSDSHPNEIAHRIAAEKIYGWVASRGILDPVVIAKSVYGQRGSLIGRRLRRVNWHKLGAAAPKPVRRSGRKVARQPGSSKKRALGQRVRDQVVPRPRRDTN